MKKKIVKSLLLATAITSISFINPRQEANAAGTGIKEQEAFSWDQMDEFNEIFKTGGRNIRKVELQKTKISTSNFHIQINGPEISKRNYDAEGKQDKNEEWTTIDLRENMEGDIVEAKDMLAGKSETPYRYYVTYTILTAAKKNSVHTSTQYQVFTANAISTCDVDSKGYPKNTKKYYALEYGYNPKDVEEVSEKKGKEVKSTGIKGRWHNFNSVQSQIKGISSKNQGLKDNKSVNEHATKSLWNKTGIKVGSAHYHVIVRVIDAKPFWKQFSKSNRSTDAVKKFSNRLYMNPVKCIVDDRNADKHPNKTVYKATDLDTLAKYYNARKKHVDTTGKTCYNLKDEYNWRVTLPKLKHDVTFEKYLCKSGTGIDDTYDSNNPTNMFSKYTYKNAIPSCSVFQVKNISQTKIPRYDEEGTKATSHDNTKKANIKQFTFGSAYLKGVKVYMKNSNGKVQKDSTQEFWITDKILDNKATQVTGTVDDSVESENYYKRDENTFYASKNSGIHYMYGGDVEFSANGDYSFKKDGTFVKNSDDTKTKANYALEETVDGKYVEKSQRNAKKTYSEITKYIENLYYKHVTGDMVIKLIYAPVTTAGKQLRINKVYYSVGEDGKTYVKSESSDSKIIEANAENAKAAYETMINSIKAGDNPVKESGTVCGTLSPEGLTRVLAALKTKNSKYIEKYPESGATKAEKDKIKAANQKSLALAKAQAIEYVRASSPSGSDIQYSLCGYSMKYRTSSTDTGNPKSVGINKNGKLVINMVSNEVWDGNDNTKDEAGKKAANTMLSTDKFRLQDCNFGCTTSDDSPTITLYYFAPTTPMTQIVVMKNICKVCEGANNSGTCKHCGQPRYEVYGGDKEIGTITDASDKHAGGIPMKVEEDEVVSGVSTNFGHETASDTATRKSRVVMPEGTTNQEEFPKVTASQISKYAKSGHGHGKESLAEHGYVPRDETYTENIHINTYNSLTGGGELGNNKGYDKVVEYYTKTVYDAEGNPHEVPDYSRPKIVHATWTEKIRWYTTSPEIEVVGQNTYTMGIPGYFGCKDSYLSQLKGNGEYGQFLSTQSGSSNISNNSTGNKLGINEYGGRVNVVYATRTISVEAKKSVHIKLCEYYEPKYANLEVYYYGLDSADGSIPPKDGTTKTQLQPPVQKRITTLAWDKRSAMRNETPGKKIIRGASVNVAVKSFAGYTPIPAYNTVKSSVHGPSGFSDSVNVTWEEGNEDNVIIYCYECLMTFWDALWRGYLVAWQLQHAYIFLWY